MSTFQDDRKRAVVLLSGGIDSSTALAMATADGYRTHALTFDYRQRHRRELESAKMVAGSLGVERHLVITFDLREIGGSALTSDIEVPKTNSEFGVRNSESRGSQSAFRNPHSAIPVTYVPARNTIFLSFALAWAEALGAEDIFIGANALDYSGYPDCRPEYLRAFEHMANLATKASVEGRLTFRIEAPLLSMTKGEIIRKGAELGLDYSLTWSCYDPQPLNSKLGSVPCGRCDSCRYRAKGFKEAGIRDPLG